MLRLPDALRLVHLLSPYLPPVVGDMSILDYSRDILDAIVADNKHRVYLDAVALMSGMAIEDLLEYTTFEIFQQFVDGLLENRILTLVEFYRGL